MEYKWFEFVLFFFIYSFSGWVFETLLVSIRNKHFCNRGILSGPWCPAYGLTMFIVVASAESMHGNYIAQYIICVVVASFFAYVSGFLAEKMLGEKLWDYEGRLIFQGRLKAIVFSLVIGAVPMVCLYLVHPVIVITMGLLPDIALGILAAVLIVIIAADIASLLYTGRKKRKGDEDGIEESVSTELGSRKKVLGKKIYNYVSSRIERAYPGSMSGEVKAEGETAVFAQGVCFDKLFWIFIICALLGDLIETVFVRLTQGVWMSRSSVIYGPFSVVWGLGAVLMTLILQKLIGKDDRYIFIGGALLGGTYEYLCSVFTEVFFGTTFWDYSALPFNINGRTNLLFCLFWGIAAIVWLKLLYPVCSRFIESTSVASGKLVTWFVFILLLCDIIISVAAMVRYVDRAQGAEADNSVVEFLDYNYPDELIEFIYPNMILEAE